MTTSVAQGYDKGLSYKFKRDKVGGWSINTMMTWPTYLHLMPIKGLTNFFVRAFSVSRFRRR